MYKLFCLISARFAAVPGALNRCIACPPEGKRQDQRQRQTHRPTTEALGSGSGDCFPGTIGCFCVLLLTTKSRVTHQHIDLFAVSHCVAWHTTPQARDSRNHGLEFCSSNKDNIRPLSYLSFCTVLAHVDCFPVIQSNHKTVACLSHRAATRAMTYCVGRGSMQEPKEKWNNERGMTSCYRLETNKAIGGMMVFDS